MMGAPVTERSEYDAAMALLNARLQAADEAEVKRLMAAIDAVYAVRGENTDWDDQRWTVTWWEERAGQAVLHIVPGPTMLDLLLPPSLVPQLRRTRPPQCGSGKSSLVSFARAVAGDVGDLGPPPRPLTDAWRRLCRRLAGRG